ncbi:MAG: aldo/keto reductase [Nitriliruptoraceae bacterium]
METRSLGPLEVTLVGLGCNNFGRRVDAPGTKAVVDAAIEVGINFFDTADVYGGGGVSEEYLGTALGSRRDDVLIATKFGMEMPDGRKGAHPDYVREACEASLRRLGTDRIDLYQLHRPDPDVPFAATLGALDELVKAGKVRAIGHSNMSADGIAEADSVASDKGLTRFVSAQEHWNVLERDVEEEVIPATAAHGLGVLPYFPLASGLLTGKYKPGAEPDPTWRLGALPPDQQAKKLSDDKVAAAARLETFAADHGHSLLELAFSWLASQPVVSSVIAGATKPEQVIANATAVAWNLDASALAQIDALTGR